MALPELRDVKTVACVGSGVIGGGWAAYFLAQGLDVVSQDPVPSQEERLRVLVDNAWPSLEALGLVDGASPDRLRFTTDLADAAAEADFVQESAPEVREVKYPLLAALDEASRPDVVISSSTSGFLMTDLARDVSHHPERFVVGHPFNPPYLMPLVEVVGGERTAAGAVDWACGFYEHVGKVVIRMEREVIGFVANRLQEALMREALYMVEAGEATPEEIDLSIHAGPGLRWAIMGHFMCQHMGGGPGGIRHSFDHFGPVMAEPYTRLAAPPLTDALRGAVEAGVDRMAGGRDYGELVRERDACLVGIMKVLREHRGG